MLIFEFLWTGLGIYFGFKGEVTNCIGAFIMARTFRLEALKKTDEEA